MTHGDCLLPYYRLRTLSPDDIGSSFLASCYQHEVKGAVAVCLAFVLWAVTLWAEVLVGGPRHPRIWPSLTIASGPKSPDKALVQERRAQDKASQHVAW